MHCRCRIPFRFAYFKNTFPSLAVILLVSSACLAGEQVDRVEKRFSVNERPLIYIRNSDGRITLRATQSPEVHVVAVKEASRSMSADEAKREADRVEVRIEQIGRRIEIEAKYPRMSGFWNHGPAILVHFDVSAPARSDVDAHSSDGPLLVDGFAGRLDLSSSDGKLTATGCSGQITSHVSDGETDIANVQGELNAQSSDGPMNIEGTFTALDLRSSDGKMDITVRPGSNMAREWSIRTSDGDIRLRLPDDFSADLDISTNDGRIRLEHALTLSAGETSEHHISGKLNKGGLPLRVHASDGSISILK